MSAEAIFIIGALVVFALIAWIAVLGFRHVEAAAAVHAVEADSAGEVDNFVVSLLSGRNGARYVGLGVLDTDNHERQCRLSANEARRLAQWLREAVGPERAAGKARADPRRPPRHA